MKGFLAQVAGQLYAAHGEGLSSLCVVLPSRRARLFFSDALASVCERPMWQPAYAAIDDLMTEISGQRAADRVRLITELYKVWSRHHAESFDDFYFWGEMLLADFDAVDKYLIDARMVFTNVRDLKALEADHTYLSEDQRRVVGNFWATFANKEGFSGEQQAFLKIWDTLYAVYTEFRKALSAAGLAYTGMQHRTAAERIARGEVPGTVPARQYVVVGFNALTECEKKLLDYLRGTCGAEFRWDYDDYYYKNRDHEAGLFMRGNVMRYPAPGPLPGGHDMLAGRKEIAVVESPSDVLQCKYVYEFLRGIDSPGKETAVVLADEGLLEPLLYSIPENAPDINVTMGYPLRQTLVYSFVERLAGLQSRLRRDGDDVRFYHADAVGLLRHPFVLQAEDTAARVTKITDARHIYPGAALLAEGELTAAIFRPCGGWQELSGYFIDILARVGHPDGDRLRGEFLTVAADEVRKLANTLAQCGLELSQRVFTSLLRRRLQSMRIPYEGEPLQGVQVMGFLETRALDFENVVILSEGDDQLPGNLSRASSFIPYGLRKAYGLPTPSHHEAMYAYYFYRLLQRARRVHIVYCSRSDERRSGEPSRYIYQLEYESGHEIARRRIALDANLAARTPVAIAKEGEVLDRLNAFTEGRRRLSPTAFFAYVVCPLRFYYRSVAGLAVAEELTEDVDARVFGNILHRSMELLYAPLCGEPAPQERIRALMGSQAVADAVAQAVGEEYGGGAPSGSLQLVSDVVRGYIDRNILPYDASQSGVAFEALEEELECAFDLGGGRAVRFYGKADRIDVIGGGLRRVVDYKTARRDPRAGSLVMEFNGVGSLFTGDSRGAAGGAIQTMLYAMMLGRMKGVEVQPSVYAVRHLREEGYSPLLLDRSCGVYVERYSDYAAEFEGALGDVLRGMFDPAVPFMPCGDDRQCLYCDFRDLCGRGDDSSRR